MSEVTGICPDEEVTHTITGDLGEFEVSQFMPDVDEWGGVFNVHGMEEDDRYINSEWRLQRIGSPDKEQIWIVAFAKNDDIEESSEEVDYIVCHYSHHKP